MGYQRKWQPVFSGKLEQATRQVIKVCAVLTLVTMLPMAAGLTGCSQAPNLPKTESAQPNDRDGAPAGGSVAETEVDAAPEDEVSTGGQPKPDSVESAEEPASSNAPRATPPKKSATAAEKPSDSGAASGSSGQSRGLTPGLDGVVANPPVATAEAQKPDATYDVVPVFFGTDRVAEPKPDRLDYGTERGFKLNLGQALVTVPLAHKVPNIERPWVVEIPYFKVKIYEEAEDPAKHFTIQEIKAMDKAELLAQVRGRLGKSETFKDHAFVFVHGFNTSFDAALYRTAQISYDMKFDGAAFVYSWPSGGKVASYTYDRGSAEQAEPYLAEFLNMVVRESGAKSISLIAHSMGNELLLRVLERMRPVVPEGVEISQVILAAPDVDRDKFRNLASQITNFSKGVTLYAASNDRALGYSARFWGGVPRAGDVPAGGPMIVDGVDTIDVTSVSTDSLGLNHSGYAENQTLLNDVKALLLSGLRPPDKRVPSLLTINSDAGVYWRYPAVP